MTLPTVTVTGNVAQGSFPAYVKGKYVKIIVTVNLYEVGKRLAEKAVNNQSHQSATIFGACHVRHFGDWEEKLP